MDTQSLFFEAEDIHKSYGTLQVLKGVSVSLARGEVVSLVGSSGAGKSTLLQIMGTLDKPDSGKVLFESRNVTDLPDKAQAEFRNLNLGFVFQFHHLLPETLRELRSQFHRVSQDNLQ